MMKQQLTNWTVCTECKGTGRKSKKVSKKTRLRYRLAMEAYIETKANEPRKPVGQIYKCTNCKGSGLLPANEPITKTTNDFPHIAIIGGGISGVALAVACLHRQIPFTLYERDSSFDARSQGYGLTLQQASKAIEGFGLFSLQEGLISTIHKVHTTDGKVIGEWGMRNRIEQGNDSNKRKNVHIARQSLRHALINQLPINDTIQWNHKLVNFKDNGQQIELEFDVNGKTKKGKADLVIGADGIRSTVRELLIGEQKSPLQYLGCIVILGICPLNELDEHPLLDSASVFQTANMEERLYVMPYSNDKVMWQLSFEMTEQEAKNLNKLGSKHLKIEACKRTQWHQPIPQIMKKTPEHLISGYPVYDRKLLNPNLLKNASKATLIGDAAHPMSPFKGQGANQALLDALLLARNIFKTCDSFSNWKEKGLRDVLLTNFESEMIKRSSTKVKGSADAAQFLHSETILEEGNETRGKARRNKY